MKLDCSELLRVVEIGVGERSDDDELITKEDDDKGTTTNDSNGIEEDESSTFDELSVAEDNVDETTVGLRM